MQNNKGKLFLIDNLNSSIHLKKITDFLTCTYKYFLRAYVYFLNLLNELKESEFIFTMWCNYENNNN